MRLTNFYAPLMGSVVLAQFDYPELPIDYYFTSEPTTPLPQGAPWGRKTANGTNPCECPAYLIEPKGTDKSSDTDPPSTGVIRKYDWTVGRGVKAPDGYQKEGLFINGQFPGPLIEANWGDTIQVTLHNNISSPEDGTALHWHGILQKAHPWMDGVPGVQQCPIPSGKSFTYSFIADLYGTSWYHSHYSAQYADGYFGPLIIHGPKTVEYDIDKGPILLSDYYHVSSLTLEEDAVGTDESKVAPFSNNNLINGRNNFNCSTKAVNDTTPCKSNAGVTNFRFSPGKKHRLRLINAGGDGQQKFSIDGHNLTIIAQDFVPIKPYNAQVVTVGIGQRTDVIVEGLDSKGAFTMRSVLAACSDDYQPLATAIVYYSHEALLQGSNSTAWPALANSLANCGNDNISLSVPWYPITPTAPTVTQELELGIRQNATGHWLWTVNNSSFRANYNDPVLLLSNQGNNSYPDDPQWNVYNFGTNTSIRILLRNPGFAVHPMHLHGHNFYLLAAGPGEWDGATVVNPLNPLRRDTLLIPAYSYAVIQFEADNPGAWPFHCHIAAHVADGLYVTILERPDEIAKLNIPDIMAQTCEDYVTWQEHVVVDQIDSGV